MLRNFGRIDESTSCLTFIFQKTSIRFRKELGLQCITRKCTAAIFSVSWNEQIRAKIAGQNRIFLQLAFMEILLKFAPTSEI